MTDVDHVGPIMAIPSPLTVPALAGILVIASVFLYSRSLAAWQARSRRLPLPPGPKPLPVVGNMLDWPTRNQWRALRDLSAQYGKHLQLIGYVIGIHHGGHQGIFSTSKSLVSTWLSLEVRKPCSTCLRSAPPTLRTASGCR